MDNFYIQGGAKFPIQQGVIINGCVADQYNCETHGVIITPRCDIGNRGKVSTIHYLPVVPLEEWIHVDCLHSAIVKFRKKLTEKLEKREISSSVLEYLVGIDDFQKIVQAIPDNKQIIEDYNAYYNVIHNRNYNCKYILNSCNSELSDLISGKHSRFYLIRNWSDAQSYDVILLRNIKRISFNIINQFYNGCQNKNFDDDIYKSNDIRKSDSPYYFKTIAQIASPYIEHIIQQFSHNFCRIGVDDYIDKAYIEAKYELDKILKK